MCLNPDSHALNKGTVFGRGVNLSAAALFHTKVQEMGIIHCFNYVRKPIYNGKIERFNRTL